MWSGPAIALSGLRASDLPGGAAQWQTVLSVLQGAASGMPGWIVVLGFHLLRIGRRIDVVLVSERAVLAVHEAERFGAAARAAAEDAALDLADFHLGCRGMPVIPVVLVANGAHASGIRPLPFPGATSPVETTRLLLPGLLRDVASFPCGPLVPVRWLSSGFQPVPGLLEAARALYARHDVTALLGPGLGSVAGTAALLARLVRDSLAAREKCVVFLTGVPGAGKTLCALNLAFAPGRAGAAFLTGNPSLMLVLREALVRDSAARGRDRRAARQRMEAVIQSLPAFRDHYLCVTDAPPEQVVIVDEAQRCWTEEHAVSKTRNHARPLTRSEPAHLLDIMARHPGGAVLVCVLGGGQEIHAGEGGIAAWGAALATRPEWRIVAPTGAETGAETGADPRQRLPVLTGVQHETALQLPAPRRAIGTPRAAAWVDAVMRFDASAARRIATEAGGVPFRLTRSLPALRRALSPRGTRQAGLVASSGARRLRAEGLGGMLWHQDEDAVASWFLERWPDIRSADALEVAANEFGIQGLELDHVGLCWDADLVVGATGWVARQFRATAWTSLHRAEAASNRVNAYRVLLTRARHGTVIWVPRGDARDATRDPALYDGVADFLLRCGAAPLDADAALPDDGAVPEPMLL